MAIREYTPERDTPQWPPEWGALATERDVLAVHLDELLGEARLPLRGRVGATLGATPINLQDYRSAALKGWGAGWPSCSGVAGQLVTVTANRSGARFTVHRRISVLFDTLIDRMEARGYACIPAQCGAYNCRAIAGTQVASNHSWGLAADINWLQNPFTTTGQHTIPLWVAREIFNPYGFAWGGDYLGARQDFMHFEAMGSPAQMDEQTARIIAEQQPAPKPAHATIQRGSTGPDVQLIQRFLGVVGPGAPGYGLFGPATEGAVRRYQQMQGLAVDGICGPATWAKTGL